jgi:hypothetical protein
VTQHELGNFVATIAESGDPEEARAFIERYAAELDGGERVARSNIGWVTGYMDPATGERARRLFDCPHPVFGMETPTPEEAMRLGAEWFVREEPTMTREEVLARLRACDTADEWNEECLKIKAAHGDRYPAYWYADVLASGLHDELRKRWGDHGPAIKYAALDEEGRVTDTNDPNPGGRNN